MNSKKNVLVAVLVVICIIVVAVGFIRRRGPSGARAKVATADDRAYFAVVHDIVSSAEKSVDVILYQTRFYFHYPVSRSNTMIADLVEAGDRDVKVRAVIEQAGWNISNTEENRDVWNLLRQGNVELYFDPVDQTSHSKLVIVDGRYVILGSSNWSHYALDVNNEANVVIDSKRVARAFTEYFESVVDSSMTDYLPGYAYISADEVEGWEERYAMVRDVADSGRFDPERTMGWIYFGDLVVRATERPLEEIMAVDSLFFDNVAGDSVRVVGRVEREEGTRLEAVDLERSNTLELMAQAFDAERSEIRKATFDKSQVEWIDAARVVPAPNEKYAEEVGTLIGGAKHRIWLALLDARYYDRTPGTARKTREPDAPPSLTNVLLADLISAEARGVEVKLVIDMGWQGRPPETKLDFLERLQAGGGDVYEDSPDVTTHAKIAIVDDDFVVIGSTNWSYHAFEENNETAVIIESPELNTHYAAYIKAVMDAGKPFESYE
ncbi:MAG: phospholipase D-like domain-containing protein [Candidatus Eisenbacteria bacterium]